MKIDLIVLFIVLNVLNVIIQTVKSIATIKCGKGVAAIVNAVAFGLYTVVVVYTVCDLPLWFKVVVVSVSNLIGVFLVKLFEEKKRKDKMWKFEATAKNRNIDFEKLETRLANAQIPCNKVNADCYTIYNCYCATQKQSEKVIKIFEDFGIKYFASESKV